MLGSRICIDAHNFSLIIDCSRIGPQGPRDSAIPKTRAWSQL
jgi:hypothetical protein